MRAGTPVALTRCMASSPSQEHRIPTQTFLLPGQQSCVVAPWERENLPKHGLPPAKPKAPKDVGTTLDEEDALDGDPCAGWTIGRCEVLRRLSPGSAQRLLALRREEDGGTAVVDVRKLELVDALAPEIEAFAASAARFVHPHLARVYPAEVAEEGLFWVSERVSGASWSELTAACRAKGKAVPLGFALPALVESATALGVLHERGQGHGLLSDQAVAVGFDGKARVLDVGLFRVLARRASWAEVLDLTGPYLSPEQVLRGHMPDAKCDVFSLGILLYEALTGERVRRTERFEDRVKMHERGQLAPPSSLNVMLPREVDAVVFRALEADRAKRYASGPELAEALKAAAGSFLWKPERRAEFVAELFATRQKKERALTAHVAKRTASQPRHRAVEMPVAPPIPLVRVAPPPRVVARPVAPPRAKKRRKKAAAPSRRPEALALAVGFVAAGLLALSPASPLASPALPAAPAVATPVVAAPPEPSADVLAPVDALVSVEPPPAPAVSLGATWWSDDVPPVAPAAVESSDAPAAKKRPAKVRPKKRRDDAPLPPWLSGR